MESKEIAVLKRKINPLVEAANEQLVESKTDMETAVALLSNLGNYVDDVVAKREEITKPANLILKNARAMFDPIEKPAKAALADLRSRIAAYQTKEKRRADDEAARLADRVGEGKGKLKIETAMRKAEEIEKPEEAIHTESGSLKFRTDYEFHLEDPIALLKASGDQFVELTLKKTALKAAAKEGRKIPGIRIEEVQVPINSR